MSAEPATGLSSLWPSLWSSTQLAVLNGKVDEYCSTVKLHGLAKKQERKDSANGGLQNSEATSSKADHSRMGKSKSSI
jgi:hypothetical protein